MGSIVMPLHFFQHGCVAEIIYVKPGNHLRLWKPTPVGRDHLEEGHIVHGHHHERHMHQ